MEETVDSPDFAAPEVGELCFWGHKGYRCERSVTAVLEALAQSLIWEHKHCRLIYGLRQLVCFEFLKIVTRFCLLIL